MRWLIRLAAGALTVCAAMAVAGAAGASPPRIAGCRILPADNPWNERVDRLPVARHSAQTVAAIGLGEPVHPDFGTRYAGAPNGIPYAVVGRRTHPVSIGFHYAAESDRRR